MSTVTLKVSERVLERAAVLAKIANVSVERMLEQMLDSSVSRETPVDQLHPNTRALLGILKGLPDKSYKEYAEEAAVEKHGL